MRIASLWIGLFRKFGGALQAGHRDIGDQPGQVLFGGARGDMLEKGHERDSSNVTLEGMCQDFGTDVQWPCMVSKKTMEVNPKHPIMTELERKLLQISLARPWRT